MAPKKRLAQPLIWLLLLLSLGACGLGAIPIPDATPTPCPGNCPPPARDNSQPHVINDSFFQMTYFDPWSVDSRDANTVTLVASTQLGEVTMQSTGSRLAPARAPPRCSTARCRMSLTTTRSPTRRILARSKGPRLAMCRAWDNLSAPTPRRERATGAGLHPGDGQCPEHDGHCLRRRQSAGSEQPRPIHRAQRGIRSRRQ